MTEKNYKWNAELYQKSCAYQFHLGQMAIKKLKPRDGEHILDIGCGNAQVTIELARKIPNGKIIGIELSSDQCEQAKQNLIDHGISNIDVKNMNALSIDYDDQFDIVFSNSAIHWLKDLEKIYGLIYKALKPEGRIMVQTGLKEVSPIFTIIARLLRHEKYIDHFKHFNMPWRFLNVRENKKILKNCGFKDILVEPYVHVMQFKDQVDLFNYWEAAGLVPFLSALPDGLKKDFVNLFKQVYLEVNESNPLEYKMTRLFIGGKK